MTGSAPARHGVDLAGRTTFGIGGPARTLWEATTEDELAALAVRHPTALVLGGGSNVLLPDEGLDEVIAIGTRGLVEDDLGERVRLVVQAGEPWDEVVAHAARRGLSGIECLSGIPGQTGATPVQNVGAYGQEIADVLEAVRVVDRRTGERRRMPREACGFRYRDSVFKSESPGRYVVLAVSIILSKAPPRPPTYRELANALGAAPLGVLRIREAVLSLRRKKGMVFDADDPDTHGAGSFFTNPIVPAAIADEVRRRARERGAPEPPVFAGEAEGTVKLAAGWLIERAGVARGFAVGRAAVSTKHALALVNRGGATAAEVRALADHVRDAVSAAWGVTLSAEPLVFGR